MQTTTAVPAQLDTMALEAKVKAMYRDVALDPHGTFHFEMGRALAERLGYSAAELDAVPSDAIDSFAGVGYYFDLANVQPGETVVDLGSGSGMDSFIAARKVGRKGCRIPWPRAVARPSRVVRRSCQSRPQRQSCQPSWRQ